MTTKATAFFAQGAGKGKLNLLMMAIAAAFMAFHSYAYCQASQTSMDRIGSTDTYNLVFHQDPYNPVTLAGVEYYVVVSGSSPSIALSVPSSSWMFDTGETSIDVGSPVVSGTTYKFPVSVWRNDNEPQEGDGLYLVVTVTDGLGICVEDYPGKVGEMASNALEENSLEYAVSHAQKVWIRTLGGVEMLQLSGNELGARLAQSWKHLSPGCYIVTTTMANGRTTNHKVVR